MRIFVGDSLEGGLADAFITHKPQPTTTNAPMTTITTGNQTMPPWVSYCTTSSSRRGGIKREQRSPPKPPSGPPQPGRPVSKRPRHSNAEHEQRTMNQA